jgi:oxalate---CoA ligase
MLIKTLCECAIKSTLFSWLRSSRRIGFVQNQDRDISKLPSSVAELLQCNDVVDTLPTAPCWDFMWNATVEEGREKSLLQQAITSGSSGVPITAHPISDDIYLAEAALKARF